MRIEYVSLYKNLTSKYPNKPKMNQRFVAA